jgi:glycosyltransferase involved in cell wall biosynthesis
MTPPADGLRVLIVSGTTSARFGGEAILPLHYFRLLRRRGVEAWLLTHARTRHELAGLLPEEARAGRMHFIPDTWFHKLMNQFGRPLPEKVNRVTFGQALHLSGQRALRRQARRLVTRLGIDVVHEPVPVSPVQPSVMYDVGAPVVMGPLNGGMTFPPAFRSMDGTLSRLALGLGRRSGAVMNRLLPGKRKAAALLVANDRTRRVLPRGAAGQVIPLADNGVELSLWSPPAEDRDRPPGAPTRFVFVGRLIELKCVDILIESFPHVLAKVPASLEIVGDGPLRPALERRAAELGVGGAIEFTGWLPQAGCAERLRRADAMVFPSVHDCGGAAVLEAMASGLPVIATNWGGPPDYVDESCGLLVEPSSREALRAGFTAAMLRLATSPALRRAMGRAGRERVEREFDWDRKVDRVLEVYARVAGRPVAGLVEA